MGTTDSAIDSRDSGSTPQGPERPPKVCAITRTEALQRFQRSLGGSTLYINTVAVALEAIASDPAAAQRAADKLNVGWRAPVDPKAPPIEVLATRLELPTNERRMRELTAQARAFVLRSALVGAVDALDAYLTGVTRLSWLNFSPETVATCTKATTRPGGKAWSISERCGSLCEELALDPTTRLLPLISLAVRWRNALVHSEGAEFKLSQEDRTALASNSASLNKAAFSITKAVERFDQGKDPTLKDVTTFVAYMQELCTSVDGAAIRRVAGTEVDVEKLLLSRLKSRFKSRSALYEFWGVSRKHEWSASAQSQKGFERTSRGDFEPKWRTRFENLLNSLGFSMTQRPASAAISPSGLGRIRGASACVVADELGLPS